MSAVDDQRSGQALEGARARRLQLRGAMDALEAALAAPVPGRLSDWWDAVRNRLRDLRVALQDHVTETEADDGLLAQIVADAPRLAHAVERLHREHVELAGVLDVLMARPVPADGDAAAIRDAGLRLLGQLARHRHKGADLVYEAYSVDVSGGD